MNNNPVVGGSPTDTFDLCVIGAGPAGYRAAEYAARHGLRVAIVEQAEVGGTCLNRGCIPTKTYVHSASLAEGFERQQQVVSQLRTGVEGILSAPGITLLRGHASFVDAHTVSVSGDALSRVSGDTLSRVSGDTVATTITAASVIISTGSRAKLLPLPDIGDPRLVTSTELLQLSAVPRRLCIIGAGVIGMEFASVFQRFGSEVTVVEYLKECLPMLDADVAKRLRKLMEKRGVTFRMKTAVSQLADIDADVILMATGRRPNTEGLNLEAAGIATAPDGTIPVDDNFRVTVAGGLAAGIYAIGDVNGRQMLAHAAEMQALRAVNHILGRADGIRFDVMPAAIFTDPEAACVGSAEGPCHKAFWRANGKALAMGETEGMLKLFYAPDSDLITGCHAFGAHAADMVQEVSALMCRDTTVGQLRDMVHIHPTLGEILRTAAEQ